MITRFGYVSHSKIGFVLGFTYLIILWSYLQMSQVIKQWATQGKLSLSWAAK